MASKAELRRRKQFRKEVKRRGGRPRHDAPRTDSGRLSEAQEHRPNEPSPAELYRRRVLNAPDGEARLEYWGRGHGLLYRAGVITQEGYELANRYGTLRAQVERMNRGPRPPRTAKLGYRPPDEHSGGGKRGAILTEDEAEERARDQWFEVLAALAFRDHATAVLNRVVIGGEDIRQAPERDRKAFVLALQLLAPVFGVRADSVG